MTELDEHVERRESFAFETTLASKIFAKSIVQWRAQDYTVVLYFLALPTAERALDRVARRVRQGGHTIEEGVVRRRFAAGLQNFEQIYKALVDQCVLRDNSGIPEYLAARPDKTKIAAGLAGGTVWTVAKWLKAGDVVLCPDGSGKYYVGEVIGDYKYEADSVLPHRRPVHWFEQTIERSVRPLITQRLSQFDTHLVDWAQVIPEAAGLSHAEIVRAAEEAARDAVMAERDAIESNDLVRALRKRKTR